MILKQRLLFIKYFFLLGIPLTGVCVWVIIEAKSFNSITFGIIGSLLFGFISLSLLLKFLFPKKIRWIRDDLVEKVDLPLEERLKHNGEFSYPSEDFFIIYIDYEKKTIPWNSIISIFGYKTDNMAIDTIRMDIFYENEIAFSISEDTLGFFIFNDKLKDKFSNIDKIWNLKIMTPVFEETLTLLYDRDGRTQEKVLMELSEKKNIKIYPL